MTAGRTRRDRDPIAALVVAWQRRHGRNDLPWQVDDPYRVWVSEVMLQQTQVAAVIPYYLRFVERFPDVASLARAPLEAVLEHWSGLGYYSRARNLHACAQRVLAEFGGALPRGAAELAQLPGIGRSTAAAIAALAFGERAAILDGNVKRLFCRVFGIEGFPGQAAVERELWAVAERELPVGDVGAYTQGLMDLGATLCVRRRPECGRCPLAGVCVAHHQGRTDALPAARPRRSVPQRAVTMLILRSGDHVLLERRPPNGVWGGLWSLPEQPRAQSAPTASATQAAELAREFALERRFGLVARKCRSLPCFVHQFTHFRLEVLPILVDVDLRGVPAGLAAAGHASRALQPLPVAHNAHVAHDAHDAHVTHVAERGPDDAVIRWLDLADADSAALPRPVKSLLQRLREASRDGGCVAPEGVRPGTGSQITR